MSARYRVTAPKVEHRTSGVVTTAFYGEVVTLEEGDAQRLVAEGAVEAVPVGVTR